jgi:hypothetical protein
MKEFFKKLWEKVKAWATLTAWPWLKKSWMQIVNIVVVAIAWDKLSDLGTAPGVETITGLWLFLLLAYYIFWKLLGAEKLFKKKEV